MTGPEDLSPFLVEVRTDKGFAYSTCWVTEEAADLLASKARHPASPISAVVKLWATTVGAE